MSQYFFPLRASCFSVALRVVSPFTRCWTVGLPPPLARGDSAAANTCGRVFAWTHVFSALGYTLEPRSGTARLRGSPPFSGLRTFQSSHAVLHSRCVRAPVSPRPRHRLLLSVSVVAGLLTDGKWDLIVILMCISLIND